MGIFGSHSSYTTGKVVSVDDKGNYQVRINGRTKTIPVRNSSNVDYSVGDSISLARIEGDGQKVEILGYSTFAGSDESEDIS